MKVAVTGAAGFVGRAVVRRLAGRGHAVRAIVRTGEAVTDAAETVRAGDLRAADLAPLLDGCAAVVNCAARVHVMRREGADEALAAYRAANRDLPLRLAQAARAGGAGVFVQLSSLAAIASTSAPGETIDDATPPRPTRPYGIAKLEADAALLALDDAAFRVVCLRPPAVFGAGVGAFFAQLGGAARRGLPLPVGGFANRRSFIHVDNLADAVAIALEAPVRGAYVVADSPPLATAELYRRMLALHGHRDRAWRWPRALARPLFALALRDRADSLLGDAACDGARFARDAGWTPPVAFAAGLAETLGRRAC